MGVVCPNSRLNQGRLRVTSLTTQDMCGCGCGGHKPIPPNKTKKQKASWVHVHRVDRANRISKICELGEKPPSHQ